MAESPSWSSNAQASGTETMCNNTCSGGCNYTVAIDERYRHQSLEEIRLEDYKAADYGREFFSYAVADLSSANASVTHPLPQTRLKTNKTVALGSDIATFRVGREAPKDFVIHEGVSAPASEFVRLALCGDLKEAKEGFIPLPEDNPDVFAIYRRWLYGGRICTSTVDFDAGTMDEYELPVHAYILGEKFVDVGFKDCITDAIIEKLFTQAQFSLGLTGEVFKNTPSHSPLRRLWMDIYYWAGGAWWLDEEVFAQPISLEFLKEFSRFQMRQRHSQLPCPI